MDIRELFAGLGARAPMALADEITDRVDAGNTAAAIDELDEIIAGALLCEALA